MIKKIDSNAMSSSDTEPESLNTSSNRTRSTYQRPNNNTNRMIIQSNSDEQKLNSIRENTQKRPSQPNRQQLAFSPSIQNAGSSDDVDSLFEQSTNYTDRTSSSSIQMNTIEKYPDRHSSIQHSTESLSNIHNQMDQNEHNDMNKHDVDCASVTSSEWGADSVQSESILRRNNASITR